MLPAKWVMLVTCDAELMPPVNEFLMEAQGVMATRSDLLAVANQMHEAWGGALCLDFANTLEPRGGPPPFPWPSGAAIRDELTKYSDLVAWSLHHETISEQTGVALIERSASRTKEAARVLARAHVLRDVIYRVFWAVANGESPSPDDLDTLQQEFAEAAAHARLAARETVRWEWPDADVDVARPLWPVAWSAVDVLISGDPRRVKVCPGAPGQHPSCGWLFYDATKNRGRRWCSMIDCGGATKARRQTTRRRAARSAPVTPNRD